MAIPADRLAETPAPAPAAPGSTASNVAARRQWSDHLARTTAVLAVLAAVSSGQYANQFSYTILHQAEATNLWAYYQAKSIKRSLVAGQLELIGAFAEGRPELEGKLAKARADDKARVERYDAELAQIKAQAEAIEANKDRRHKQGVRFQYAFVILQAGVVLSTIASGGKRRELWVAAIAAGLLGLAMLGNGFLLLV
jgi:hypothetical protein